MKVTIITVCYNSEATIEDTIRSVISQDYNNIEYILIDGQSKDQTLALTSKYKDRISKIVSEKDEGIFDAINKGIALASGEIIGILHSDDSYVDGRVISKVVDLFTKSGCASVYGDLDYVDRNDPTQVIRHWRSGTYKDGLFLKGWMPPHPTFFIRRECYSNYGNYSLQLRSASDYELMLRMLHKYRISVAYLPEVLVKMRSGGKSNSTLLNRIKANREDKLAWQLNGLKPGHFTLLLKPLSKIRQYF